MATRTMMGIMARGGGGRGRRAALVLIIVAVLSHVQAAPLIEVLQVLPGWNAPLAGGAVSVTLNGTVPAGATVELANPPNTVLLTLPATTSNFSFTLPVRSEEGYTPVIVGLASGQILARLDLLYQTDHCSDLGARAHAM